MAIPRPKKANSVLVKQLSLAQGSLESVNGVAMRFCSFSVNNLKVKIFNQHDNFHLQHGFNNKNEMSF